MAHLDTLIPAYGPKGIPYDEEPLTTQLLQDFLARWGPKYGRTVVKVLTWTRDKIVKWTGMEVSKFIELMKLPNLVDWGSLTDSTLLLQEAAAVGHEETVQMLLEKLDQTRASDQDSRPNMCKPFHNAAFYGHRRVVELFLEHGVNVDLSDDSGSRATHKAAEGGCYDVLLLLFESDADAEARDAEGNTPLDKALSGNHHDIVRLLMKHRGALIAAANPITEVRAPAGKVSFFDYDETDYTGFNSTIVDFYVDDSSSE